MSSTLSVKATTKITELWKTSQATNKDLPKIFDIYEKQRLKAYLIENKKPKQAQEIFKNKELLTKEKQNEKFKRSNYSGDVVGLYKCLTQLGLTEIDSAYRVWLTERMHTAFKQDELSIRVLARQRFYEKEPDRKGGGLARDFSRMQDDKKVSIFSTTLLYSGLPVPIRNDQEREDCSGVFVVNNSDSPSLFAWSKKSLQSLGLYELWDKKEFREGLEKSEDAISLSELHFKLGTTYFNKMGISSYIAAKRQELRFRAENPTQDYSTTFAFKEFLSKHGYENIPKITEDILIEWTALVEKNLKGHFTYFTFMRSINKLYQMDKDKRETYFLKTKTVSYSQGVFDSNEAIIFMTPNRYSGLYVDISEKGIAQTKTMLEYLRSSLGAAIPYPLATYDAFLGKLDFIDEKELDTFKPALKEISAKIEKDESFTAVCKAHPKIPTHIILDLFSEANKISISSFFDVSQSSILVEIFDELEETFKPTDTKHKEWLIKQIHHEKIWVREKAVQFLLNLLERLDGTEKYALLFDDDIMEAIKKDPSLHFCPYHYQRLKYNLHLTPELTPRTFKDLTLKEELEGFAKPKLYEDSKIGQKFIVKKGASEEHCRNEFAVNQCYQVLGLNVPNAVLLETEEGVLLATHFVPSGIEEHEDNFDVTSFFIASVLLGNWDIKESNFVAAPDSWLIHTWCGFDFRSRGSKKKSEEWNSTPRELLSLRDKTINPEAAELFEDLTEDMIGEQVVDVLNVREQFVLQAPEKHQTILDERIEYVKQHCTLTFLKDTPLKFNLNGIPFKADSKSAFPKDKDFSEKPIEEKPDKWQSAGALIFEKDGRIWLCKVKNDKGCEYSFAKSSIDHGESPQYAAHRQTLEATGLRIRLLEDLIDQERGASITRFYIAERTGGLPTAFDEDQTECMLLVTLEVAAKLLSEADLEVLKSYKSYKMTCDLAPLKEI